MSWLVVTLSVVMFQSSTWNRRIVEAQICEASAVYEQCHVRIQLGEVREVADVTLEKYDLSRPNSIAAVAEAAKDLPRPTAFFVKFFDDGTGETTPFSRAQFVEATEKYPASLNDTVWFPQIMMSDDYIHERAASPYSTVAHELTHVMTLDGDHNNDAIPNLMTIYMRRTNVLTEEQCREIRRNPLARP